MTETTMIFVLTPLAVAAALVLLMAGYAATVAAARIAARSAAATVAAASLLAGAGLVGLSMSWVCFPPSPSAPSYQEAMAAHQRAVEARPAYQAYWPLPLIVGVACVILAIGAGAAWGEEPAKPVPPAPSLPAINPPRRS